MNQPQPWTVLGLDPAWFAAPDAASTDATRSALIRRAYRRALLQHHPDKQSASTTTAYTVDQIKSAYAALGGGSATRKAILDGLSATATGLEIVDLDELPSDEVDDVQTWYRSCRCGNPRGFTFDERDLEEELDAEAMEALAGEDKKQEHQQEAMGELMVGCQDCSLWLCVHFAAAPEEEEEEQE